MYKNLGYVIYRTVLEYYSGNPDEDAYGKLVKKFFLVSSITLNSFIYCVISDMRKALSRDVGKLSVVPLTHPVRPEDIEWELEINKRIEHKTFINFLGTALVKMER